MSPEYPASAGAFIIADDKALVYRLQADRWDGIADMNDPAVVRRYLNFFDEVWQTSMQESQMRQMLMYCRAPAALRRRAPSLTRAPV